MVQRRTRVPQLVAVGLAWAFVPHIPAANAQVAVVTEEARIERQEHVLAIARSDVLSQAESLALERSLAWQVDFGLAVEKVREVHGEVLAGARVTEDSAIIMFVGKPPVDVSQIIGEQEVAYEIVGNFSHSEARMNDVMADVHGRAVALLPLGTHVRTDVDLSPARVNVLVSASEDILASVGGVEGLEKLLQEVITPLEGETSIDVSVTVDEGLRNVPDVSYGAAGGTSLRQISGNLECTSAFVVKRRTSAELGPLTAAHCPDDLSHNNEFNLLLRNEHFGGAGDIQWHRSPRMMDAWFHYDRGVGRPVSGTVYPMDGQRVWKFGVNTGRTDSTIRELSICINYPENGVACNVVEMDGEVSAGRDSGGPWYVGTTAYGVHSGRSNGRSVWTPVGQPLSLFDLNLCIDVNGNPSC